MFRRADGGLNEMGNFCLLNERTSPNVIQNRSWTISRWRGKNQRTLVFDKCRVFFKSCEWLGAKIATCWGNA